MIYQPKELNDFFEKGSPAHIRRSATMVGEIVPAMRVIGGGGAGWRDPVGREGAAGADDEGAAMDESPVCLGDHRPKVSGT